MTTFLEETEANFDAFTASWKAELPKSISALDSAGPDFLKSYRRIAALNAWRQSILESKLSTGSLEFFCEALNDALTSHVFGRSGSWRSALKALRSCIENTCYCLYYKDHPVELRLWELGRHRLAFSETINYLEDHPDVATYKGKAHTGISTLRSEFGTLSRAVHASSRAFRMSKSIHDISLWNTEPANLGQWKTREMHTLTGINLLLIHFFKDELSGTKNRGLRTALGGVIPKTVQTEVRTHLAISFPAP